MQKVKAALSRNTLGLVVIVMFAFCSLYNTSFLSKMNLTGMLVEVSYMTLLAIGMTFAILTGGIDLSVGAVGRAFHGDHRPCDAGYVFGGDVLTILVAIVLAVGFVRSSDT